MSPTSSPPVDQLQRLREHLRHRDPAADREPVGSEPVDAPTVAVDEPVSPTPTERPPTDGSPTLAAMAPIEVPRAAVDVVEATDETPPRPTTWDDYVREQLDAMTFESDHDVWSEGQRIFVRAIAEVMPPGARVLDCACGDGVGLAELSRLGFDPVGVELAGPKADRARSRGFEVHEVDMHTLDGLADESFDVVMSSHTLEHALEPARAVASMRRVLRPGGQFHVVLPYPDPGDWNRHVHVAKEELGTHDVYRPDRIVDWFVSRGFVLTAIRRDDYREPEIWLSLRRDD